MISTTGQQEYELQIASDELDRSRHLKELQELFKQLDVYENGKLDERSLMNFLADISTFIKLDASAILKI